MMHKLIAAATPGGRTRLASAAGATSARGAGRRRPGAGRSGDPVAGGCGPGFFRTPRGFCRPVPRLRAAAGLRPPLLRPSDPVRGRAASAGSEPATRRTVRPCIRRGGASLPAALDSPAHRVRHWPPAHLAGGDDAGCQRNPDRAGARRPGGDPPRPPRHRPPAGRVAARRLLRPGLQRRPRPAVAARPVAAARPRPARRELRAGLPRPGPAARARSSTAATWRQNGPPTAPPTRGRSSRRSSPGLNAWIDLAGREPERLAPEFAATGTRRAGGRPPTWCARPQPRPGAQRRLRGAGPGPVAARGALALAATARPSRRPRPGGARRPRALPTTCSTSCGSPPPGSASAPSDWRPGATRPTRWRRVDEDGAVTGGAGSGGSRASPEACEPPPGGLRASPRRARTTGRSARTGPPPAGRSSRATRTGPTPCPPCATSCT